MAPRATRPLPGEDEDEDDDGEERGEAAALLGPAAALLGHYVIAGFPTLLGAIMVTAAGGILYLIFEDIAPQAPLDHAWAPPLGAVLGFALGLLGHLVIH